MKGAVYVMIIYKILYIIVFGFMVYRMFKGGGCCGGHSHHGENSCHEKDSDNKIDRKIITEKEKMSSIDIE